MISFRILLVAGFLPLNLFAQVDGPTGTHNLEAPEPPAVEAPDSEWDRWSERNSAWMGQLEYRRNHDLLSENAQRLEMHSSDYNWKREARFRGLTWNQIQALGSGGVISTGRKYFLGERPEKPLEGVFVTSDMILHAYNMMVADLVRGIEIDRAPRLRRSLETVWNRMHDWHGLSGPHAGLAQAALGHAQRVIGTALLCLGSSVEFHDPDIERDCRSQLQLITTASAKQLPSWLFPCDGDVVGIDYTRMKPVGIYSENRTLADLYRAVRWLQAVPFRPDRDVELVAFAILAEQAEVSGLVQDESVQRQWLGLPNSLTLSGVAWLSEQTASALQNPALTVNLDDVRANLAKQIPPVHGNDDELREPKQTSSASSPSLLKILPAYLTADALLISEIITKGASGRFPEGKMITAFVGDVSALSELKQDGWSEKVLEVLAQASSRQKEAWASPSEINHSQNPFDDTKTLNSLLFHSLAALFLPPAEGAPAFMASPAWRAKTRNTVLSAWAEKKHTWVLHEVEPSGYLAGGGPPPPPPGLIEPNPEFFHRMAALAEKNIEWMEHAHLISNGKMSDVDRSKVADNLKVARMIHELGLDGAGNSGRKVSFDDFCSKYSRLGAVPFFFPEEDKWEKLSAADFVKLRESALISAEAILHGLDPETSMEFVSHPPEFRRDRWCKFLNCVKLLEKMVEKQLRFEEWNKEEREYLTFGIWNDYIEVAYMSDNGQLPDPQSLGPKIAPVASDPNSGLVLHVGTGEQSEIYVLYPWKGTSYLYRGPIIPYYELPSKTRLDDQEWRALLTSDKPPAQPRWLSPFAF